MTDDVRGESTGPKPLPEWARTEVVTPENLAQKHEDFERRKEQFAQARAGLEKARAEMSARREEMREAIEMPNRLWKQVREFLEPRIPGNTTRDELDELTKYVVDMVEGHRLLKGGRP